MMYNKRYVLRCLMAGAMLAQAMVMAAEKELNSAYQQLMDSYRKTERQAPMEEMSTNVDVMAQQQMAQQQYAEDYGYGREREVRRPAREKRRAAPRRESAVNTDASASCCAAECPADECLFPGLGCLPICGSLSRSKNYFPDCRRNEDLSYNFYGYVFYELDIDTKHNLLNERDDKIIFVPAERSIARNCDCKDLNSGCRLTQSAIETRLGVEILGPDVWCCGKTRAVIEADFLGAWVIDNLDERTPYTKRSTINGAWCRQAFMQVKWDWMSAVAGYTWHPFYDPEVAVSEGTLMLYATPFEPVSRNPQLRVSACACGVEFMAAMIGQTDFRNVGPDGLSTKYLKDSCIPEFAFQVKGCFCGQILGVAADVKVIRPHRTLEARTYPTFDGLFDLVNDLTVDTVTGVVTAPSFIGNPAALALVQSRIAALGERIDGETVPFLENQVVELDPCSEAVCRTSKNLTSVSATVFGRLQAWDLVGKFRFTYADNLTDQMMLGGFGVRDLCSTTTSLSGTTRQRYSSLRSLNIVADVSWQGECFEPGIMIGYSKNIGVKKCKGLLDFTATTTAAAFVAARDAAVCLEELPDTRFATYTFLPANIDHIFGVAPRIVWNMHPISIGAEFYYLRTVYGILNDCGKVRCGKPVDNFRFTLGCYYYF